MSKKATFLNDELYQYLQNVSLREPQVLQELRQITATLSTSVMQISPEQGQFMGLLARLMHAKRTIEVGVYTGYSALSVALALPQDGQLIACDVSEEWTSIAREFWQKAGMQEKISLRLAPAEQTLQQLLQDGLAGKFDMAFIDADKENYDTYYEQCLRLMRQGGLILIDNTLWSGEVIDVHNQKNATNAIRALNAKLLHDDRIYLSLLAVGDGLTLAMKK